MEPSELCGVPRTAFSEAFPAYIHTGHRIESGPDSKVGTPGSSSTPDSLGVSPDSAWQSGKHASPLPNVKIGDVSLPDKLFFPTTRLFDTVGVPDCRMPDCFPDSIRWPD